MSRAHPNLVAWYKGNGNALDSSGNGHHGTWVGTPAYAPGKFGQGFDFGQNAISLPPLVDGLPAVTLSMWIEINSYVNNAGVICLGPSTDRSLWLFCVSSGSLIRMQIENSAGDRTTDTVAFGLATAKWHHLAIVYNGSTVTPYINGVAGSPFAHSGVMQSTGTSNVLGEMPGVAFFDGLINDLRIYNAALSPSDIKLVRHGFQPMGRYV